ncbi:MerR family DNA-binding transcriptional regulator [Thioalkalivibrio sp.]|uniref:MerR family DNA-binding transcriptional regulator n=1 Tax=Thioalkalivibrio sp. TaxID=2093813 RepID=UPI0035651C53
MKPSLRICEVASPSGCSPETIRHYEKPGLLGTPYRTSSGYRLYGTNAVARLGFIRNSRIRCRSPTHGSVILDMGRAPAQC